MTLGQSQVHNTNHPDRMMGTTDRMMGTTNMILYPARSHTTEMKAEPGDVDTEETRLTTRPHKFPVPGRIDAIDTHRQTVADRWACPERKI